jgi:hypothetical protein
MSGNKPRTKLDEVNGLMAQIDNVFSEVEQTLCRARGILRRYNSVPQDGSDTGGIRYLRMIQSSILKGDENILNIARRIVDDTQRGIDLLALEKPSRRESEEKHAESGR